MYIAIDLETTGLNSERDEIIEIGAIVFDENGKISEEYQSFINTQTEIPEIVTQITGIQKKDLLNAPQIKDVSEKITNLLKDKILVGHNIEFDISFLKKTKINLPKERIDTLFLASAILPKERSHSLESLCKTLNLKNKSSHNALEDAKSSMKLFLILQEKFHTLEKSVIDEIKKLSTKSGILPESFFKKSTKIHKKIEVNEKKEKVENTTQKFKNNSLNEIDTDYFSIASDLIQNKKRIVSMPAQLCGEIATAHSLDILDSFEQYIDSKRLNAFIKKTEFKPHEIKALIKVIVWISLFPGKPLRGIKLFNEEKKILFKINRTEKYTEAKSQKTENAVITHEFLIQNPDFFEEIDIIDLSSFKKSFEKETNRYLNLESFIAPIENMKDEEQNNILEELENKSIILFGLIGIYFEKNKTDFENRLLLPQSYSGKKDLKKIKDTVNNIISTSKNLIQLKSEKTIQELSKWKENLQIVSLAFRDDSDNNFETILIKQKEDQIGINLQNKNLNKKLSSFFSKITNLRLFDLSLNLNDNAIFSKSFYAIPEKIEFINSKPLNKKEIKIVPEQTEEIEQKAEKHIKQSEGNTLIIANSKILLKKLTLRLNKTIKDKLIFSETLGSIGKLNEQISETKAPIILIVSPNFFEKIEKPENFQTVLILTIPFSKPDIKFTDFEKQTLPETALRLKKILKMTSQKSQVKIFDKRITNANYGTKLQTFLNQDFDLKQE